MRFRPLVTLLLALAAVALFAAGCGGDDDETTTPTTTEETTGATGATGEDGAAGASTVTMAEYSFTPSDPSVAQGDSIDVVNDGSIPHNLTVEGTDLATADLEGGASEELTVDLDPGDYEIICSIADHADQGMTGTLTVD